MGILERIGVEEYRSGYYWPQYPLRLRPEDYTDGEVEAALAIVDADPEFHYGVTRVGRGRESRKRQSFFIVEMWERATGGHALPAKTEKSCVS